jgi:hypothetical protein
MPTYDLNDLARRIAAGESLTDIASDYDGPPPNPGDSEAQRSAARADAAFHSEGVPPGDPPAKRLGVDIMDAAFQSQGGVRVVPNAGMGDRALEAGISKLFERASKGDPEAVYKHAGESWDSAKRRYDDSKR